MPGSSGMLALGMFNKDRDMKRVKKADGGMMTAQVMPAPMPNRMAVNAPRATFGGGMGPNAPEGRGYNREGFKGRGPMGMRKPEGGRIVGGNPAVGGGSAPTPTPGLGTPYMPPVLNPPPMTGGPAPIVDRGMALQGGPAQLATPAVGFKKGGMVSKGVSKGKHSSVTPAGGRAGGKTKPCKIY